MKKEKVIKNIVMIMIMLAFPFAFSCRNEHKSDPEQEVVTRDLDDIRENKKLIVVTDFNSINYFIYRGQPMGFQYDLLQELSDYLGLEIEVKVNNDLAQNFNSLLHKEVDLIASNLTITEDRKELVAFSEPVNQTRQVLVQRNKSDTDDKTNNEHVKSTLDLAGKTVYLQRNSVHVQRLNNLSQETGENISMIEVPIETEQLIRMVSRGEIDYTVADEDIARVNNSQYPNLNVETILSFPQHQGWAMRKESVMLKNEIDAWLNDFKKTRKFAIYYNKYFHRSRYNGLINSEYYYPETGRISAYDDILREEAEKIGWDWRILASMIYQESRFNPKAVSWAGAFGIRQLMPMTARNFGVDENSSPQSHIRAGVRFIKWLDKQLDSYIEDENEKIKFILASYNVGFGHVQDAMKLAEKYGRDPRVWEDNVEYFLLKKSEPEFYMDPVVRNGYARGTETYIYVREIMERYNHYLNVNDHVDLAQILQQSQ